MLTWSDWRTEPRSNRFHYASRFARKVPVLFVQPDEGPRPDEATEVPGVTLVHVGPRYDAAQLAPVAERLAARGFVRPLLWVYNPRYTRVAAHFPGALRVLHATEDYFSESTFLNAPAGAARYAHRSMMFSIQRAMVRAVQASDLVVCVSAGVAEGISANCSFAGELRVIENGCDFVFWSHDGRKPRRDGGSRVAIYQGGINERLDENLMAEVVARLPDWEFRFYGRIAPTYTGMERLKRAPNFHYLGTTSPESLREAMQDADVGLMPYRQLPALTSRLFPLKAFEYSACGLPVVSVPIDSVARFPQAFAFARTAEEFAAAIVREASRRDDPARRAARLAAARAQDYDGRFAEVEACLARLRPGPRTLSGSRAKLASLFLREQWNRVVSRATRAARL
jgi:glycosyltransferase involved in cell wall biosynthesis